MNRSPPHPTLPRFALSACLLALAACGGGSTGSSTMPTVTLSTSPASIAPGASSTLTWSSTEATSCSASGAWSGAQATSGSRSVTPGATESYTLACTGAGGTAQASATVTVVATSTPAPTVSLVASPASVAAGGTSTLTWSTTNATSCTASGSWSGSQPVTGGTYSTGALSAGASFMLSCSGTGGTTSKTASVTIQASGAPTAASASALGPLAVQKYSSGIVVPSGARFQQPTIWYPTGGTGPYPGVVFVPGYTSDYLNPKAPLNETDVVEWATFLASHGFVVMFINSANIAADGPPQKMDALLDAVDAFATESARSGSPISGLLQAQNIAVMGHSFGGAAALFAANAGSNARIKAVVALSPVPNNGSFGPYPNDTVPSLILCGQGDPLYSGFQGEYNAIPGTTSKLLAIFLANSEYSTMHNIARNPLGTHGTDATVARYGLSFLEVYLAGDARYQQFLASDPLLQVFAYNP